MSAPHNGARKDGEIVPRSVDERVQRELDFHIEMRTRELIENGMSPADARQDAIRRFGNLEAMSSDLARIGGQTEGKVRRARYLHEVIYDARAALKLLGRRRGFAALAIGTLALGIGAATAIYSVVDGVLLRPLPFADPDRIAAVWITQPSAAKDPTVARYALSTPVGNDEYQTLRRSVTTLKELALFGGGAITLTTPSGNERVESLVATSTLLPLLQVRPVLGRAFLTTEDVLNGPDVAMLSWESWQTRFGGDSAVLGRRVTLNERPYEIIGVLPAGVRVDRSVRVPEFWLPALRDSGDLVERHNRNYRALARLAPGATYAAATQEVARTLRSMGDSTIGARVEMLQSDQTSVARGPLLVLLGAAAVLLLIACVNVAILQLGEASARAREMATRAAMGAGTARLVRQLLVESLALSLVSMVVGTAFAWLMIRGLVAIAPERLPGIDTVAIDARVLLFAVASAVGTGLVFGILPAAIAGRSASGALVRSSVGATGRGARVMQRTLVAVQLGLSMVLLVEAALLTGSLRNLSVVDPGFRPADLVAIRTALPRRYDDEQLRRLTAGVLQQLAVQPGVERVSASTHVPFVSGANSSPIQLDEVGDRPRRRSTQQRYVVPGFFETMGMRLVAGRFFTSDDRNGNEAVAIVSASEVARDFPGESPLGKRVKHQGTWRRIVGVVADVKYRELGGQDESTIYVPFDQYQDAAPVFLVRGNVGPNFRSVVAGIVHELEPRATVTAATTLPSAIEKSYASERYRTVLVTAFGSMAALLAAIGLYGVSVRSARRRSREIGIRLAIGGTGAMVQRLLVSDAMKGVAIGLIVGTPASLLAGRLVTPYLFGITANDPRVLTGVGVALMIVTAIASAIPAWSAAKLNPAVVLRSD